MTGRDQTPRFKNLKMYNGQGGTGCNPRTSDAVISEARWLISLGDIEMAAKTLATNGP